MIISEGRKRVIITNVKPAIEGGKYPAKSALGEDLVISADIFSDGHDEVSASVFVKQQNDPKWQEIPMKLIVNDHWEAVIPSDKTGFYEFKVKAWVDHFVTWQKGLKKKYEAGQDIKVELQIGAQLIEQAMPQATRNKTKLKKWITTLNDQKNPESAVSLAVSPEVSEVMYCYRDENLVTEYPVTFRVEVERKKAAYSSWYELFPRSTAPEPGKHGTFKDVQTLLPRVAKMGFDVLYFPPIHPYWRKKS